MKNGVSPAITGGESQKVKRKQTMIQETTNVGPSAFVAITRTPDWSYTGGWRRESCVRLFKYRLSKKHPEIDVVGEYVNRKTPVRVRCAICGTIFTVLPSTLLDRKKYPGVGCMHCPGYDEARKQIAQKTQEARKAARRELPRGWKSQARGQGAKVRRNKYRRGQ
jgi:hypothetical protein